MPTMYNSIRETRSRKTLSACDQKAAARLRQKWLEFKEKHNLNQDEAAAQMGWTQGNFSQYINGNVRLGDKALRAFCNYFGCRLSDIREEYTDPDILSDMNELKRVVERMTAITESIDSDEARSLTADARRLCKSK